LFDSVLTNFFSSTLRSSYRLCSHVEDLHRHKLHVGVFVATKKGEKYLGRASIALSSLASLLNNTNNTNTMMNNDNTKDKVIIDEWYKLEKKVQKRFISQSKKKLTGSVHLRLEFVKQKIELVHQI
jgi:hypothetical protein